MTHENVPIDGYFTDMCDGLYAYLKKRKHTPNINLERLVKNKKYMGKSSKMHDDIYYSDYALKILLICSDYRYGPSQ